MKKSNIRRKTIIMTFIIMTFTVAASIAYADDPLRVINNFTDFIYTIVRAAGILITIFGIVQLGIAIKAHDPTQRSQSFLAIIGGIIIMFVKDILALITG